ncbi:sensor histidine kinase [Paenibacillus arenilitoris]|uniref:histidine kinase n=1 Tax=Paenibacillus arenilitoris TaxID=2772299 RepID=A0A927CPH1_9BACL|nr:HAMP domain-containing sensor histidine kinase [Paenibacillus arenilitoris]MBD2869871.1 HAMP domain-containing histidine kinase [Paenibacillus arenilitoris]
MDELQFLVTLRNNRDQIIRNWLNEFLENGLEIYEMKSFLQEANSYFTFMLDIGVPFDEHEHVRGVPGYYKKLFENKISSSDLLHSNHIWRNTLMQFIEEQMQDNRIPMNAVRKINHRLDQFERYVFDYYNECTNRLLADQESTISELHEARMTIIGKMAASMAHEIRNPLTSVLGFIKMIRHQISERSYDKLTPYLDIIEIEFQNIQMHITGFLSFSKKDVIEEPVVEVSSNSVIDTVISLIHPRIIDENIELDLDSIQDTKLHIQKIAIQQVLSNILINSIDAMYLVEGVRKIRVSSRLEGDSYLIAVTNNGPEIPYALRDSLFTPFVTSKKEGTGLGLAISKQIMNRNQGDITFTSNPNETTFVMKFQPVPSLVNMKK